MTIKGLTDRQLSFPEIGQIRKGAPKDERGQLGKDLDYFRVEFDEKEQEANQKFLKIYGEQPQEINILLPFDEIERCWDAWLEAYTAGRMVARADGEKFIYWVDTETNEIKVKNGEPYTPYREDQVVGSYIDKEKKKHNITCESIGRLKVVVPELQRLAYMTVMTSSVNDIGNLSAQLQALKQVNAGKIAGIPMVLRRRPKKISTPKADGTRARYTKWMLSIEADPAWVKAKLLEVKHAALPDNGFDLLPEEINDDIVDVNPVEEEIVKKEVTTQSKPEIDPQFDVILRKPEELRTYLVDLADEIQAGPDGRQAVERGRKGIVLGCLEYITAPGDTEMKRHALLKFIFGVSSSNDLTDPQWRALGRYLKPQKQSTGEYIPEDPVVSKEINNLVAFLAVNSEQEGLF